MEHIRHLKRHKNILYGLVFLLIVVQIISFVVISSQLSGLYASQQQIQAEMNDDLDEVRADTQFKFNEVTREIAGQKNEFQGLLNEQQSNFDRQLQLLKSAQQDFSAVIEKDIRGVVSVGTDKSAGTGFIIDSDGYIVTNEHVISGGSYVKILTYDGKVHDATIIGEDKFHDISLLKIEGSYTSLELADSDNAQIGEKVIAIGNPLGLSFTVTEGIISALHRRGPNGLETYIQTDVTLNPGNSGGPLINTKGEVVGINNFKIGEAEGLGFALESNVIREVVNGFLQATLPDA